MCKRVSFATSGALVAAVAAILASACERSLVVSNEGTVAAEVVLPAAFADLDADIVSTLRVTIEAPGATAQVPLALVEDSGVPTFAGTLEYEIEQAATLEFRVRIEGALNIDSPAVLLGEGLIPLEIEPQRRTAIAFAATDIATSGDGSRWDENRNGVSNLDDLARDVPCPPTAQTPPVRPSATGLQFSPTLAPGEFERQVLVLDNISDAETTVALRVIGAPGVGVAPLSFGADAERQTPLTTLGVGDDVTIAAQDELLVAVTFAPADASLASGYVFLETTDRCGVVQAQQVRVIANADGGARTPPAAATGPDLDTLAASLEAGDAAGLSVRVIESGVLFAGTPITLDELDAAVLLPLPGDATSTFAARAGAILYVPAGARAGAALVDVVADIDLYAARVQDGALVSNSALVETHVGTNPEALQLPISDVGEVWFIGVADVDIGAEAVSEGAEVIAPSELYSLQLFADTAPRFVSRPAPAVGPVTGGTEVTLFGEGFASNSTVRFAGVQASVLEIAADGSSIRCVAPAGDLRVGLNPATIVVTGPVVGAAGSTATLPEAFVYSPASPAVILVTPPTGSRTAETPVVVRGANFTDRFGPIEVRFGTAVATSVRLVSATEIDATAPVSAAPGTVDVTVSTAAPFGGDPAVGILVDGFSYVDPLGAPPVVTSIAPDRGPASGNTVVVITGENFAEGAQVSFGETPAAAVTRVDATRLDVLTALAPEAGDIVVRVANPDGQTAVNAPLFSFFAVSADEPSVFAVTPDVIHGEVDGDTLTLFGQVLTARGLAGAEVRDENDVASLASVLTAGPSVVQVRNDAPLAEATAYRVRLLFDDGTSVDSPSFSTFAPTVFEVTSLGGPAFEGEENNLVLSGAMLAPNRISDVVLTSRETAAEVVLLPLVATEALIRVRADAGLLSQGEWDVAARYSGGFLATAPLPLFVGGNCGNNIAESNEDCDGDDLGIASCTSLGRVGGVLRCNSTCTYDTSLCTTCGDDVKDDNEACDGADLGGLQCADVGSFTAGTLLCNDACSLDANACTECGNNIVEDGEQCDAAQLGGQQCSDFGFSGGALGCTTACFVDVSACATCGDGVCGGTETNASCASDCLATCNDGNETCDVGETCSTCPGDCSLCAPYAAAIETGANQIAPATAALAEAITVRVVDDNGDPAPGVVLNAVGGSGTHVASLTATTDVTGVASFFVTLGRTVGEQTVTISGIAPDGTPIDGLPIAVTATAEDLTVGTVTTIVGREGTTGVVDPQGTGAFSLLQDVKSMVFGDDETLYIADAAMNGIFALSPTGSFARIAGGDPFGPAGNGGPALDAAMDDPRGMAFGPDGRLYVAERDRVRAIDFNTGLISLVAGGGVQTSDGVPATAAFMDRANQLAFDAAGNLYIGMETGTPVLRRVDGVTNQINTVLEAGTPCDLDGAGFTVFGQRLIGLTFDEQQGGVVFGFDNNGAVANACTAASADLLWIDGTGAYRGHEQIQPTNTIRGLVGTAANGALFYSHEGVSPSAIVREDALGPVVIAGAGAAGTADFGLAADTGVDNPGVMALSPRGDLAYRETLQGNAHSIRLIRGAGASATPTYSVSAVGDGATTGVHTAPSTLTGATFSVDGTPTSGVRIRFEAVVGADAFPRVSTTSVDGTALSSLYVGTVAGAYSFSAQAVDHFGRTIGPTAPLNVNAIAQPSGTVYALNNNGAGVDDLDENAPYTLALPNFSADSFATVDVDETAYFSSTLQHRVYRIDAEGLVTVVAGNGSSTPSTGGPDALAVGVPNPTGLALDGEGGLFIASMSEGRILRLNLNTGALIHIGGNGLTGSVDDPNEGGDARLGALGFVKRLQYADGALYLHDSTRCRIRKIEAGVVTTIAGTQCATGCPPSEIAAISMSDFHFLPTGDFIFSGRVHRVGFCQGHQNSEIENVFRFPNSTTVPVVLMPGGEIPDSLATDPLTGEVYAAIDDTIVRIELDRSLTPIAGDGVEGSASVPVPAGLSARVQGPRGLSFTEAGDLVFVEADARRVRRIVLPRSIP